MRVLLHASTGTEWVRRVNVVKMTMSVELKIIIEVFRGSFLAQWNSSRYFSTSAYIVRSERTSPEDKRH